MQFFKNQNLVHPSGFKIILKSLQFRIISISVASIFMLLFLWILAKIKNGSLRTFYKWH